MFHPEAEKPFDRKRYDDRLSDDLLFDPEMLKRAVAMSGTEHMRLAEQRASVELSAHTTPTWRISDETEMLAVIDIPRGDEAAETSVGDDNGRIAFGRNKDIGYFLAGPGARLDAALSIVEGRDQGVVFSTLPVVIGALPEASGVKCTVGRQGVQLEDYSQPKEQSSTKGEAHLPMMSLASEIGPETSRQHLVVQIEHDGRITIRNHGQNGLLVHRPETAADVRDEVSGHGMKTRLRRIGSAVFKKS